MSEQEKRAKYLARNYQQILTFDEYKNIIKEYEYETNQNRKAQCK